MERNYLQEMLPFLTQIEKKRQEQFEIYFHSAPLWVMEALEVENIAAGTIFIHENEPADMIYFVGIGKVKATDYRVSGIAFDFMKPDNVIALGGMEVIMEQGTYKTTVQTETDCVLVKLSRAKYEKWLYSDPETFRLEAKLTCHSLLEEERRNRLYLFLQGADRLALLYVELYEKYNKNGTFYIKESRTSMADETGLCLKSVSRAIRKFSEAGLVTKNGSQLQISKEQYEGLKKIVTDKIDRR
ncbi:Crp/Fnr family transcriptional regulator [Firmicutes bacterium AM31-12AC]|nr:Crp/Fnr family transcriptional regulator [Firmicutes bacterium AM31-12AC]